MAAIIKYDSYYVPRGVPHADSTHRRGFLTGQRFSIAYPCNT